MTEVAFHFNATDKWAYSCRLLRKAVAAGSRVVVTGTAPTLAQLDRQLWEFSATDFVPHCSSDCQDAAVLTASPVVLCAALGFAPHHEVLLNLGDDVPSGFEQFERLLEVVGLEPDELQRSRTRWKHYKDRGYLVAGHDVGAGARN